MFYVRTKAVKTTGEPRTATLPFTQLLGLDACCSVLLYLDLKWFGSVLLYVHGNCTDY